MRALLLAALSFALGVFVGQRGMHKGLIMSAKGVLSSPGVEKCADVYQGYPLSPVYAVEELQPGKHPIPGLAHITIHGKKQHGLRNVELWMETFAPGAGTPIHRHDCEEIWLIVSGQAVVAIQDKGGRVVEAPLGPNSTFVVLPNARHQVRNTGSGGLQAIVVIDNPPFRPFLYKSWDEPYSAGQEVSSMLWDRQCPDYVPASLEHLVTAAGKPGGASSAEVKSEM